MPSTGVIFAEDFARRSASTLPLSKASLKAFAKRSPDVLRDPPADDVVWLTIADLLAPPRTRTRTLSAAFVAVAFDCYLRPSEALGLRRCDVSPPTGLHPPISAVGPPWC